MASRFDRVNNQGNLKYVVGQTSTGENVYKTASDNHIQKDIAITGENAEAVYNVYSLLSAFSTNAISQIAVTETDKVEDTVGGR